MGEHEVVDDPSRATTGERPCDRGLTVRSERAAVRLARPCFGAEKKRRTGLHSARARSESRGDVGRRRDAAGRDERQIDAVLPDCHQQREQLAVGRLVSPCRPVATCLDALHDERVGACVSRRAGLGDGRDARPDLAPSPLQARYGVLGRARKGRRDDSGRRRRE